MRVAVNVLAIFGAIVVVIVARALYRRWRAGMLPAVIVDEVAVLNANGLDTRRGRVLRAAIRYREAVELSSLTAGAVPPWGGWASQIELARVLAAAAALERDDQLAARSSFAGVPASVVATVREQDRAELVESERALRALLAMEVAPTPALTITPTGFAPPALRLSR